MDKEIVVEKVNEFLIDEFELEEEQLLPDALMKDDLDIESLDFVDIAVILEKEFGIKVNSGKPRVTYKESITKSVVV